MEHNPIQLHLDAAGLPWRSPRNVLAEKYGIRKRPAYGWDVIRIDTAQPLVSGKPLVLQAYGHDCWIPLIRLRLLLPLPLGEAAPSGAGEGARSQST